jgi:hypothetical protein
MRRKFKCFHRQKFFYIHILIVLTKPLRSRTTMTLNGYTIQPILKGYQIVNKDGTLLHYFKTFKEALNKVIELLTI